MNDGTKLFILTISGAVILAAAYLYFQDWLFVRVTGRPASERERDRIERKFRRPLTRTRYLGWTVLVGAALFFQVYLAIWSGDYKGWTRLIPLGWMVSGGVSFYCLQKFWWSRKEESTNQLSGEARK